MFLKVLAEKYPVLLSSISFGLCVVGFTALVFHSKANYSDIILVGIVSLAALDRLFRALKAKKK